MSAATDDPLIGELVDGRWRVTERLGAGGMGAVYKAERLKLGKSVAIKFLDVRFVRSKEAVARFDREARAISRLAHAHCVSILDFGVHQGRPFIVMEYVAGRRLTEALSKKVLTPVRAVSVMRQILDALRHAHAHGVVHRDLKPDNVMLAEVTGQEDYVKILDFGLARIISIDEPNISVPALVAGTPSWMSPEQASGKKADHRSDIYSAGMILYAMCVGKKPYASHDTGELLKKVREAPPPPPRKAAPERNLSEALERVILKALAKSPDDRFYTAADFLAALDATPEGRAAHRHSPASRRTARTLRLLGAAALVALGAAGALLARSQLDARPPAAASPPPSAPAPQPAAEPESAPANQNANANDNANANANENENAPAPADTDKPSGSPTAVSAEPEKPTEPAQPAEPAKPAEPPKPAVEPTKPPTEPPKPAVEPPKPPTEPPKPAVEPPKPVVEPAKPAVEPPKPTSSDEAQITALLAAHKQAAAVEALRALIAREPTLAWPHLLLGEVYFQRLWRRDCIEEWQTALRLDPALRHDPRLKARLCATYGPKWLAVGARRLHAQMGDALAAATADCPAARR